MITQKKHIHILFTLLIISILFFSGCTKQTTPKKEQTIVPTLTMHNLKDLHHDQLTWFQHHLNTSTGFLTNTTPKPSIIDQLSTGHILSTIQNTNPTIQQILNNHINTSIQKYKQHTSLFNLNTTSLFLHLLCTTQPTQNTAIKTILAESILNYTTNQQFNTTPLITPAVAYALTALTYYSTQIQNTTIQTTIDHLNTQYNQILHTTAFTSTQGYYTPWFTAYLSQQIPNNQHTNNPYQILTKINTNLSEYQEKTTLLTLGTFTHPKKPTNTIYHLHATQSMMIAYNQSKTQPNQTKNDLFHQSFILGLINIKNTYNNTPNITINHRLLLLPLLHQARTILPNENWTYLWNSDTQQLIKAKSLETSPTVWTALTIGVMGSIGLLALVFIIINLYYKNKR
jgi:hypothetical protein